eukprot:gene11222-13748_t
MTQSDVLTEGTALKQFVILSKSGKGRACVAVVEQALNHPTIYVFGELLDMPNIQQLQQTEFKQYYDLLYIFAYGTYNEYKNKKDSLPALTPQMTTKLRQLTIVHLSATSKVIPYLVLQKELDISNVRELEDLIIDSIYQNIIRGKLDQKNKHLEIEFAIGRDVPPSYLNHMISVLDNWNKTSEDLLNNISALMQYTEKTHEQNRQKRDEFEKQLEIAKSHIKPEDSTPIYDSQEYNDQDMRSRKGAKIKGKEYKRP